MANIYQQAAKQRKAIYLAAMGGLLLASLLVRGTFFGIDRRSLDEVQAAPTMALTLDGRAKLHELTELQQGDKELGGAAIQLLLTGSRGLAVCALWYNAIEKQKKQEWNELDISVDSITKLQPHFTAPWLFQSWNLAYNVSVEMDRLNDMYFYIARGISVLAEGESLNRNNPDLRWNLGFYYQNKFGVSDRVTTLRCLYQLSCIPEEDRDPDRLVTVKPDGTREVNLAAFEDFCRAHPQLVRRLKEVRVVDTSEERAQPLASNPAAVVTFLRNNRKVPSRYLPGTREMNKDRLKQFPVFPDLTGQPIPTQELDWTAELADHDQDAFLTARSWFSLANACLPPPNPKPNNDGAVNPDPLKYRIPKRPATIIFRQGPPRAQTYLAERLTREGWFDQEPWAIDELIDPDRAWLPKTGSDGERVSARFASPSNAQQAWQEAAFRWQRHGADNGLRLDPNQLLTYITKAEEYTRLHPGTMVGSVTPALTTEEAQDPHLADLHDAHVVMHAWSTNRQMTNFESFELESATMQTDAAIRAKKRFYQADRAIRDAADYSLALQLYDEGFEAWKQALLSRQDCRALRVQDPNNPAGQRCQDFRDLVRPQEEVYEFNRRYTKLAEDTVGQRRLRQARLWVNDLLRLSEGATAGNPFQAALALNVLSAEVEWPRANPDDPPRVDAVVPELKDVRPLPVAGPLDGLAPDGTPWITDDVKQKVRERLGVTGIRRTPAPSGTSGSAGGSGTGP